MTRRTQAIEKKDLIVLLAKRPGVTSFSSLKIIKKVLGTKKIGHTGTLDSFAQGLLVCCVGGLTRLAGRITEFDKTYEAVIEFGSETDTLDPTGAVVKNAPLPSLFAFLNSLEKFHGKLNQIPPSFSAIKIGGARASDILRKGESVEIPSREIFVYDSELKEIQFEDGELKNFSCENSDADSRLEIENDFSRKIKYARVEFRVSKGTYIRSLARDIGEDCGSAAHLAGLLRTKVGAFSLRDAAFCETLAPFTIQSVVSGLESGFAPRDIDMDFAEKEVLRKSQKMSGDLARACGFGTAILKVSRADDFFHGRPLRENFFASLQENCGAKKEREDGGRDSDCEKYAVFLENGAGEFCGVVRRDLQSRAKFFYEFVFS
ncbi:MAG: tRNA pseudouridine(55) synthase TruB [Treponemataceae bacterium]|nr:tRNA pseudouridine(55) synthase TruB [Treponemataceae bacterium]